MAPLALRVIAGVLLVGCGSPVAAPSPPSAPSAPLAPAEVPPPDLAPIEAEGFVRAEDIGGTLSAAVPRAEHDALLGDGCAVAVRVSTGPELTLAWPAPGTDAAVACADREGAPVPLSVEGPPGPYRIAIFRAAPDASIERSTWSGGTAPMVGLAIGLRHDGLVPIGPWRRVSVAELDVDRTELPGDAVCRTVVLEDPSPVVAAPAASHFHARLVRADGSVVWTTSGRWLDACSVEPEPWTLEVWGTTAPVIVRAYRAGPPETWTDHALDRVLADRWYGCGARWLDPAPCLTGTDGCEAPRLLVERSMALAVLRAADCAAVDAALGRGPHERSFPWPGPPVHRSGTVHLSTSRGVRGALASTVRGWLTSTVQPALLTCYERELAYRADAEASGTIRIAAMPSRTFVGMWTEVPGWLRDCSLPTEPLAGTDGTTFEVDVTFTPAAP